MRLLPLAFAATLVLPAAAQDCRAAYGAVVADGLLAADIGDAEVTDCATLALLIEDHLSNQGLSGPPAVVTNSAAARIAPRDLQPARGAVGGAGGAGQIDAVPGLETEPLVGGGVSAVGTGEGAGALATFSLNPRVLFGRQAGTPDLAADARTVDLSVLVPIDDADRDGDGRIDYVGVRGRVNLLGKRNGEAVYDSLLSRYIDALGAAYDEADRVSAAVDALLREADDATACARQLLNGADAGCGAAYYGEVGALSPAVLTTLDQAAAAVREAVDEAYFGLDTRLDVGDPTLGTTPGADGFAFGAFVAYGRGLGLPSPGVDGSFRLHLGVAYADRDSLDARAFAVDGAAGLAFSRVFGLQRIEGQVGLQGQVRIGGDVVAEALDGNRLMLNGSLNVPVSGSQSASVRLALPLLGESVAPVLSLTGNWHLPLPEVPGF